MKSICLAALLLPALHVHTGSGKLQTLIKSCARRLAQNERLSHKDGHVTCARSATDLGDGDNLMFISANPEVSEVKGSSLQHQTVRVSQTDENRRPWHFGAKKKSLMRDATACASLGAPPPP